MEMDEADEAGSEGMEQALLRKIAFFSATMYSANNGGKKSFVIHMVHACMHTLLYCDELRG